MGNVDENLVNMVIRDKNVKVGGNTKLESLLLDLRASPTGAR
jgi:hypothetical protein